MNQKNKESLKPAFTASVLSSKTNIVKNTSNKITQPMVKR